MSFVGLPFRHLAFRQNARPYTAATYVGIVVKLGSRNTVLVDNGHASPDILPVPEFCPFEKRCPGDDGDFSWRAVHSEGLTSLHMRRMMICGAVEAGLGVVILPVLIMPVKIPLPASVCVVGFLRRRVAIEIVQGKDHNLCDRHQYLDGQSTE